MPNQPEPLVAEKLELFENAKIFKTMSNMPKKERVSHKMLTSIRAIRSRSLKKASNYAKMPRHKAKNSSFMFSKANYSRDGALGSQKKRALRKMSKKKMRASIQISDRKRVPSLRKQSSKNKINKKAIFFEKDFAKLRGSSKFKKKSGQLAKKNLFSKKEANNTIFKTMKSLRKKSMLGYMQYSFLKKQKKQTETSFKDFRKTSRESLTQRVQRKSPKRQSRRVLFHKKRNSECKGFFFPQSKKNIRSKSNNYKYLNFE